jgi:hypothetical protein
MNLKKKLNFKLFKNNSNKKEQWSNTKEKQIEGMLWSEFMYFQNMRCEGDMYLNIIFFIFYSYNTPVKKSQLKFFPTKTYKDKMIIIIIFLEPISWVNLGQSLGHSSSLRSWVGLTIINLS